MRKRANSYQESISTRTAVENVYATKAVPDFESKYLDMLSAGGKLRHKELLAPFGLDATDPDFWRRGMKTIERFIDELERLSVQT